LGSSFQDPFEVFGGVGHFLHLLPWCLEKRHCGGGGGPEAEVS